jgi:hypothetical protein
MYSHRVDDALVLASPNHCVSRSAASRPIATRTEELDTVAARLGASSRSALAADPGGRGGAGGSADVVSLGSFLSAVITLDAPH